MVILPSFITFTVAWCTSVVLMVLRRIITFYVDIILSYTDNYETFNTY
jgi:hypothetical protein